MIFTYTIHTTPDPENPNEQPSGTVITDDRLYNRTVAVIHHSAGSYTPDFFNKAVNSNKLTMQTALSAGANLVIICAD